ncbi:hypothetical protein CRM22_010488 [Opisthorchis felineus]|uniref:DNA polymerase delta subunit 3 n=1 Tax=Opisthorchis felineus TaxID=147828 RepID=A0A4S2KZD8_OPIFE|nr:hypothetical protein CRM22_010488 [Opisthorchis felineus]
MEEQMLFENLDEKLEDELAVITTTWLSINFELQIGEAEGLLNKYFTSHPHLSAVFLLTGLSSEGEVTIRLTPNEKLRESEAVFVEEPARTIYSVQRHPCRSSTTVSTSALFSDVSTDALKKLVTIPWCPTESSRQPLASCENKQNELGKQPGIPVASNHSTQIEKPKPSDISNFFTTTSKPTSTTVLQKQGQKRPSTFFDTKPGKVSPKMTLPEKPLVFISQSKDQEEEEEEFLTSAVLRSSKRKRLIIDSDEEEAITGPVEKFTQSRASPRKTADRDQKTTPKVIKKILAADSETDSPTPKPARGRRPRSAAATTETEREAPIASPSRESRTTTCSPKKPQASKPKSPAKTNRRRRQVLKTFMDDDGYMVTEKVWESASENDDDEPIRAIQSAVDAEPCVSPPKHDTDALLTGTPTLGSTDSDGASDVGGIFSPVPVQDS